MSAQSAQKTLLLFGDQTIESVTTIRHLAKQCHSSALLRKFFREVTDCLQRETATLYTAERERFFGFDTILALAEEHARKGDHDVLVSTVLLCIAQMGSLIIHTENDPTILGSEVNQTHMIGLCTGLLPATAAAAAKDTSQLLRLGLEIVRISFRVAVEASRRSEQIEEERGSWAFVVCEAGAEQQQQILDEFHQRLNIPTHKHAYISAISKTWTTISGPPSVMSQLFEFSGVLGPLPKIKLPITSAFHAKHLVRPGFDQIIGPSSIFDLPIPPKSQLTSTSTCRPYEASTLRELLHGVLDDIFQLPLEMSKSVGTAVASIDGEIRLYAAGPTNATSLVRRAFEVKGQTVTEYGIAEAKAVENARGGSDAIAIVGMAARLPGSETLEEFWDVLEKGQDLHKQIPADRFNVATHYDPTGKTKNTTKTQYGCFIDRPGLFDTRLFNMSPREAAQIDPGQRLLLMTTYEALEMAGYTQEGSLSTDSRRIGTYFGQCTDDWREIQASQDIDLYYVPGGLRVFAPGRLNYHFKWEGPSYSIDGACSSSAAAVSIACAALNDRECDTALAGGVNILTGSPMFAGLSRGSFLSSTGGCKTFDDTADGYCRGEGIGVVVLKRLEDAIAENDNIQAVIRATATNHSAHAASITQPHAETQVKLYQQVLERACVEPNEVEYVEMHGTGTQAGDNAEIQSVTRVLARGRTRNNPLYVGTAKSSIGHGEASAGVSSLIKTVLMLRENVIPPHCGIKTRINKRFPPLAQMNVRIADRPLAFRPHIGGDGKRRLLINNFNATGGNTAILVEDAPKLPAKEADPRAHHVVACSARTEYSLAQNKRNLLAYIKECPETRLCDLAYTTTARRMHNVFRSSYVASTTQELITQLEKDVANNAAPKRITDKAPVVFAFTGQGSQYAGMGKHLFETSPRFRESILAYQTLCERQGLPSFVEAIINDTADIKSMSTVQIQLAMVSLELALANLWKSWGIKPDVVVGHSLGEYAALAIAGVLSITDALYLVGKRASLMQKKCTAGSHIMVAVQSPLHVCERLLSSGNFPSCQVACINGPNATVISGTVSDIDDVVARFQSEGVKTTLLRVPYAFHSAQLDPILVEYEEAGKNIRFNKPSIPVASTLKGAVVKDEGVFSAAYLVQQARNAVDFVGAVQASKSSGLVNDKALWVEIGPEAVCIGLARQNTDLPPARQLPTLKSADNPWKTISKAAAAFYAAGVEINWPELHKDYLKSVSLLELPTYAFDTKNHWIAYEGDWALKNGQPLLETAKSVPVPEPESVFTSTSLQRVEKETTQNGITTVEFLSEASELQLYNAIQGHLVMGVGLCPSSVYSDMAFTAAKYIHSKTESGKKLLGMSLQDMKCFNPLVVLPGTAQTIQVVASRAAGSAVDVRFSSDEVGIVSEHAHCQVAFGDGDDWKAEWARTSYLIKGRMETVAESTRAGLAHRILRPMVYKLFASLVAYEDKYQGLQEVCLDSGLNEAIADIKFRPAAGTGTFTYSPYWIDTIVHLAGFVLNGNVTTPEDTVYLSNGWDSVRIAEELSEHKIYQGYVRMQPVNKRGLFVGDVYVFDGDTVVAVCAGLKFQRMKKPILAALLGADGPSRAPSRAGSRAASRSVSRASSRSASRTPRMDSFRIHSRQNSLSVPLTDSPKMMAVDERPRRPRASSAAPSIPELEITDTPATESPAGPSITSVLQCIAEEAGVPVSDLSDDASFADLGIDSLLTISITSKLKELTGVELPTSMFSTCPTVSELKKFFEVEFGYSGIAASKSGLGLGITAPTHILTPPTPVDPPRAVFNPARPIANTRLAATLVQAPTSGSSDVAFTPILEIIADEVGIDMGDLVDDANFGDLGVDSLLTISITSKLREITGLELPANMFSSCPTVAKLKVYFAEEYSYGQGKSIDHVTVDDTSSTADSGYDVVSRAVTPQPSLATACTTPLLSSESDGEDDCSEMFLQTVVEETGVDRTDIQDDTFFSDLGVDSLMSIAILTKVKNETGLMLAGSFFTDNPTVAEMKSALRASEEPVHITNTRAIPPAQTISPTSTKLAPPQSVSPALQSVSSRRRRQAAVIEEPEIGYKSNVVFLQGRPSSGLTSLFMIADGAGSAASYLMLPPFPSKLPVYALESPFLHCPLEYNCSIEECCEMYVKEIRKIQPHGPYMIGGWSLGGVYAYETCRQLVDAGEKIRGLIMIDSRVPKPLPDMLEPTMELLEQAGLFIGIKRQGKPDAPMSLTTKQHLLSCVKALRLYDPRPFEIDSKPASTFIIWAKYGLFEVIGGGPKDTTGEAAAEETTPGNVMQGDDRDLKSWFYAKRNAFGPNGWDNLR